MRLSFFSGTRARSRLPKKSLASIASWLVVAPLISLGAITFSVSNAIASVGTTTGSTYISSTLTSPTDFYLTVSTGTSIELWTTGSGDPTLWLYDKFGNQVGYNDDASGLMSYIMYSATNPNNGPYRVRAGRCCGNPDAGFSGTAYQLRINLTGSVSSTNTDTTPPSVSSFTSSNPTSSNSNSFAYTLTMSESITGLDSGDFANSGTATGCSFLPNQSSGTSFTITVTGCVEGTLTPRLNANTVADTAPTPNTGPSSNSPASTTITIDRTAPTAPGTPDLQAASDLGSSNTDNITTSGTRVFTGSAEANATVQLFVDGVASGSTCVATSGTYACTTGTLSVGTRLITSVATDAAGNASTSSGSLSVVVAAIPGAPTSVTSALGGNCTTNASDMTGVTTAQVGADCVVTFTNPGSTTWSVPSGVTSVQALVVGGGGSGGRSTNVGGAGGGGAGGVVTHSSFAVSGSVSVNVGAGGASQTSFKRGNNGAQSSFSTLIAPGGGGGGLWCDGGCEDVDSSNRSGATIYGIPGGSGGGSGAGLSNSLGGSVTTPALPVGAVFYGNVGGDAVAGNAFNGTGGGGAGGPSASRTAASDGATAGGPGISNSITGSANFYAAGGGGSGGNGSDGAAGGSGIGGAGSKGAGHSSPIATGGAANTGSGGGGAQGSDSGKVSGAGGSGVVIIRYTSVAANSASVSFSPPASNGGTAVTGYEVVATPSSGSVITATGASSPIIISGLTLGVNYTFTIRAQNAIGFSSPATNAGSLTATAAPGAPTIGTATIITGTTSARVAFTAPASNGGSTITTYTAISNPGGITGTISQAGSGTITVSGLSPNTSYTFTVTATNAAGTSIASAASNAINTPQQASLTYNGNGNTAGNVPVDSSVYLVGQSITVLGNTGNLSRTGYTFAGWTINSSGTGTVYTSGNSYALPSATSILYARWTANTYTITYDTQGGSSISSGLVGYWNFNDSTAIGKDSVSGNALSATGATYTVNGKNGGGLSLAGGQYLGGTFASLPTSSSPYTIGGWINTTSAANGQGILGWGSWGSGGQTNAFRTTGTSGFVNYWWSRDLNGSFSISNNTWIHAIATYDGTTRRIYVNGSQVSFDTAAAPNVVNSNFRIGSTNNGEWFYGTLDDIVVYNRSLSASEIMSLYTTGPTVTQWTAGTSLILPSAPTRSGYTFNGWYDAASGGTRLGGGGDSYLPLNGSDFSIFAQWTANTFVVTYNYNNATGGNTTVSSSFTTGGPVITLPTPSRTGYTFGGWFSDPGLTASIGAAGANYTPASTITVHAKWNGISNTVAYDAQGGSTVSSVTWATGASLTLPAAPTLAGYTFSGWYDAAAGGTRVGGASASYSPANTAGFTLYAQWSANTNTITFNTQGGSDVASQSWVTATTLNLPAAPTRAGYTFNGWFAAASGGSPVAPMTTAANGLSFDGSGRVNVPHSNAFNFSTDVTIEAWIKTTSTSEQYITTKNDDSFYFGINLPGGAGKVSLWLNNVSPGSGGWLHSAATVNDGNWHHVAATYDGSTIRIYVDGVLSASRNVSSTIQTGSNTVVIGARGNGARFVGSMYDIRFWNVARSASQISSSMNSTLTGIESGLVAHYSLNQGSAGASNSSVTTAVSSTGNHDGTLVGFALSGGTSNWIQVRAGSSYNPTNTSGFTLYAQWSANTNTVTFDSVGGSSVASRTFQTGSLLALPSAPTLVGSTFVGWFLATTGGSALPATYSPVATSDFTIYARWNTNRTLAINSSSFQPGYARTGTPPTLTATPSAGVNTGSISFTSATTSVCTVNATSGLVAFLTTGTCTISATITETGGFTAATSSSISFAIRATPGAPTNLAATPGNSQVTISWSAPSDLGGGVSSYLVTASSGGGTCTWTSGPLSCVVTGLTNGIAYSFTVVAVNAQGTSAASAPISATPRTVPGAPAITSVTPVVQDNWRLVYQTTSPTRSGNAIVYSAGLGKGVGDQAAQLINAGTTFNRVRYRMEVNYNGVLRYADVSFDKWSGATIATLAIPDMNDARVVKVNVTNLNIDSNWPGFTGVAGAVTTGTGKSGRLELWPFNYSQATTGITPAGSGSTYDYDDSSAGSANYGSFQVHNLTDLQTVLAWNRHYDSNPDLGFGNYLQNGNPDWTFAQRTNFDLATWRLRIFIDAEPNSATVAFTAPASTGGSTITGYTVTASNGSSASGQTSPINVPGLSLGIPYTFTVTATNAAGTSVASAPSTSITLRGSPSAPSAPVPSLTVGGVSLVWSAPNANGGTISDYTIQYSADSGNTWTTFTDGVSPATATTVRGLVNGTAYVFRVLAISEQGSGSYSLASSSITPSSAPEAPGKPSGTSSGTSITVTWSAATNNGSPITNYIISYSSDSGNTWTTVERTASTATSSTVSSLTAGMTYIFRVMAVNARGSSSNSEPSNPIAVGTAPQSPTTLVATVDSTTSTSAVLNWKKPTGGAGIVEAQSTLDATSFTPGLLGRRYIDYYADNVNFFNTARLFQSTGTPVNSTSIMNFSSNADFYSWMWTGYFKASMTGVHRFYLSSDDASHLWIGDVATTGYTTSNATVNNGGLHPTITRVGSINLVAGTMYPIRLMFGEFGGGDVVSLFWDLPNGTRITNGTGYFFQNPTGAVAAPVRGCAATVGNSGGVQISREGSNCVLRFTNPGVNTWTVPTGVTSADVLVVGGGGGAGFDAAGGGGGGAVVERLNQTVTPGAVFNVNVGNGGATSQSVGGQALDGGNSTFGSITAVGGGGGGSKNANGRGVIGAGGGGGGHANPGSGGGVTLGGVPSTGADSFWGWSASNSSMVNNQGSVAQFSYIQASLTRTIPLNINVASGVTFNVSVDNSINNIIGWRGERIDTYSIRVELLNSSGGLLTQQIFNGSSKHNLEARSVTVPFSGAVASVRLTITGFDAGYWAGFYGPIFRNPSLLVDGAQFPAPGTISGFGGGGANGSRAVGNGGGGGGAGGIGASSATSAGGVGVLSAITNTFFGGGGGGGSWNSTGGAGGQGGGGNGGNGSGAICGSDGAPNTGGGGGAMGNAVCSNRTLGAGGSGVVIVRYAAANTNVELPPPSDYVIQYSEDSPISWQTFDDGVSSNESATVTGLIPGKKYIFRVASRNGVGTSSFTAASNVLDVRGAPAAPVIASVTAGNQRAIVNITAPTNTGGSPITRYTASAVATGTPALPTRTCVWNVGDLRCTIGELANGRTYTVTLTATNAFGTSATSSSLTVTPKTTADAPTAILATTNVSGEISLTWTAPTNTGGTVITGYKIERSTVAAPTWVTAIANTATANTSANLTGLVNGTLYNIRITALNEVGEGALSDVISATPRGVPGALTAAPTGNGSNASAFITWSAPINNGSPITDYEIQFSASASGPWTSFTDTLSSATAVTVTGLTNGTAYFFRVRALNIVGAGAWSAASTAITPATTPGAPTLNSVEAPAQSPGRLNINFSAGTTGGSPITGYEFSINAGATWSALTGTSDLFISDLTNGVRYTIQIRAVNAQGVGPASASASGTPTAPADAPVVTGIVAGDGTLTLSFSAPANNGGSAITGYRYQILGSAGTWSTSVPATSPLSITGLTNGQLYSVRLLSINGGGNSAWSTPVQSTPFTIPSDPTITAVTPGNGSLTITYTASNNGSAITAAEYSIDNGSTWIRSITPASPFVISGLINGTSYAPQLRLINAAGVGGASTASGTIPFTTPFAPAITSVVTSSTSITMNFTVNPAGNPVTNISHRIRSVAAPGLGTSCAAAYGTLTWSNNWSDWTEVGNVSSLLFDNLLTSNCYDIQIRARNAAGYGGVSRESGKPVAPPSAPSIIAITPGAGALGISFNESADNGGSAITAYEYQIGSGPWVSLSSISGFTLGTSTYFVIGSLTNGSSYSIRMRAANSAGTSAASAALSGMPVTTPSAPVISNVAPLDGALSISFTAPSATGGSAILGYQYSLTDGSSWVNLANSATLTNFIISGLSNSTGYQVRIRAINAQGFGTPSAASASINPGTVPQAPSISAVVVGNQQISLVVSPGLDGGYPLTNFAYSINDVWVELTPDGGADPLANPIVITSLPNSLGGTSLSNGTSYRFKVRANNSLGESLPSSEVTGTPATTASAPTIAGINTGNGTLAIVFTAPTSNGGNAITTYDYSLNGGTTWTRRATGGATSPLNISGLTNGVAYNVKIRAINGIGAGAESAILIGIPQVPGAGRPTSVTTSALNGSVRVNWTAPESYVGSPIVGYRVNATPGTASCSTSASDYTCVVSGLTNGTNYTFTVTSLRDDNGTIRDIDTSNSSSVVAPRTVAAAPTAIVAVGGGNEAALSWTAPTNTGGAAIIDYRIEFSSDSGLTWSGYSDLVSAETSATVGGLRPGTRYKFRVAAVNAAGSGSYSLESNEAKTFEQAPELTLTLDQQTADGFSFILSFQDPISYSIAATTNNPNATVEQAGDFFTVRGLGSGASVTVTVTANRADYLQAIATIFSSALISAPAPAVLAPTALDGGFRFTISDYAERTAEGTSYTVTATAGAVIDDGNGIYRIVGLANGESAIATVTSSRPGYVTRTTSVSASALALGVAAQIANITGTRDGFTFSIANYSPEANYIFTSSNSNAVIARASDSDLVTVTGLANLESATLTVKTVRTGFMDASAEVTGVALPKSEVNTLAAISLSSGSIAFDVATYEYTLNVSNATSTYRVTPTKSDADSTITIAINGGAATAIASGVQSNALPLVVGENTIVIAVTSQVGSVQNYTLYVKRAKSSIATLSGVNFSSGTVTGFDSAINSYELTVPYGSSTVTATASPTSAAASMKIKVNSGAFALLTSAVASDALALNVGNNLVTITVTAEDELTTATYEFIVTRAGALNSQLGALTIDTGTMPTFASGTLNYEVIVPIGTTSVRVTPTLSSATTGSITVNGVDLPDGAQSQAITLTSGATTSITILVSASDGSSTPYVVNVKVDAPPVSLALARASIGTQSSVAFTTQPQIAVLDAAGNRVLLNTSTVSVAITSGAGGELLGTTNVNAVRGLATFTNLAIRGVAGTTYTLTYSSGGLTVATQQITLTPGEAVALAFRAGSTNAASGAALAIPLQVAAVDSDNNTVSTFGGAISLTSSTGGTLVGANVRTPVAGLVTFSDLAITGAANTNYTITASTNGLTSTTRTISLTFGAPVALGVTRASAGPVSGAVFATQPQITIRDSAGNTVTSATGEVSVSIASGTGGTLNGTTTAEVVNGVATFTNLAISGTAGTAYTLAYAATGVLSATETLTVTAGAATRIQLASVASGFNNGNAFRTQPVLRIQDASGNTVTSSTATITASVSSGGVLLGTLTQSASSGIVTFTNLGIFGTPGSAYTVTFAAPGLTSATQTVLLTSGSSLIPTFGATTPTFDGFTVQITNFSRIFNWTFALLEGSQNAQISLGGTGLLTITGMEIGSSAIISASTARSGFENGAATVTGSTLLAPLRPTFSATTSTASGFRAQVTNFDSSFTWRISASNGGTASISSTGLITVIDLNPGVSSDVTVTTSKTGRVSASSTVTGTAIGAEPTAATQDVAVNLLTGATVYALCAGGSSTNEGIANLNDRNSKTKYLCFNSSSKLNATYIRNSAGFYTSNIGSKVVTGIRFTSGDSDRSRDPIIYSLFGCSALNTDCAPIVINGRTGIDVLRNDTGALQSFLNKVPYNFYKVTFGALRTSWTDALQIAEIELMGTDANATGLTPIFGAVTRTGNGFTVPITNFDSAFTWRATVTNSGGVAIGSDGVVTVTGLAGNSEATVIVTTTRAKYENSTASVTGFSLNAALIPTFGTATPTADGFTVPINNYSGDFTWSTTVASGAATITGGVLTVTGQTGTDQAIVTVTTTRANYATGRAQVVATALADGLTPNFGASVGTADGFTIQVRNYSSTYTWSISSSAGAAAINGTGLITISGLNPGANATVNVTTSRTGAFTVIVQATGKALIGSALTPRFGLTESTADGFTAQILNYDANYTWSGSAAGVGQAVTISNTGLVTVTGVATGRVATATISAARTGYVTGAQTISGTAVPPDVDSVGGSDIQLQVPVSASTSPTEVIVTIDIPVDAAPGSTTFTGSAVATDSVDQGLRTVKIGGVNSGTEITNVSTPIAITIPASAGVGIPVYSPDGLVWLELPLLAGPSLPDGQEMGYFRYDDGTIVILTRKIGG